MFSLVSLRLSAFLSYFRSFLVFSFKLAFVVLFVPDTLTVHLLSSINLRLGPGLTRMIICFQLDFFFFSFNLICI